MIPKKSPKLLKELLMVKNNSKTNNRYEEYTDEKALHRDKKKKPKMPVKSAFLKQIPKIQQDRFENKYDKKPFDSARGK